MKGKGKVKGKEQTQPRDLGCYAAFIYGCAYAFTTNGAKNGGWGGEQLGITAARKLPRERRRWCRFCPILARCRRRAEG